MFSLNDKTRASALRLTSLICLFVATGCAGYQTPDQRMTQKLNQAKLAYDTCTRIYKANGQLKAFADLLLTESISAEMMADSTRPNDKERTQIRLLANKELNCRKNMILSAAQAVQANYTINSSPTIASFYRSITNNFVRDTETTFRQLSSGNANYGQFYTEMKGLILKRDRSIALHSVLSHVEDGINYEQRRAAVDQAMSNVNRGMQKHCIGCAFSRENKEETSGNGAGDSWSGVFQGHEINGTND